MYLYIEGHTCETMKGSEKTGITISYRLHEGKKQWFWEQELQENIISNGIKYCPYCGVELPKR